MTNELGQSLASLVSAAIAAGEVTLEIRQRLDSWEYKADGSPVTAADRAAEDLILGRLAELDPGTRVVAEERIASGDNTKPIAGERFYLVDALDGTREFVNRRSEYTVNIALIEGGIPTTGVVIAPALGEGFAADVDGAVRFRMAAGTATGIERIEAREPQASIDVLASLSHINPETEEYLQRFAIHQWLAYGSSLKFCRIAEGIADFYPRLGRTMEWDIAAGDAILRRAGGSVRTLDGQPMRYGKCSGVTDAPFANPHFLAFGKWPQDRLPF